MLEKDVFKIDIKGHYSIHTIEDMRNTLECTCLHCVYLMNSWVKCINTVETNAKMTHFSLYIFNDKYWYNMFGKLIKNLA